MDFESKIISREISQLLWEMDKTVGTAESCTGSDEEYKSIENDINTIIGSLIIIIKKKKGIE